jgi:hypothetical protein
LAISSWFATTLATILMSWSILAPAKPSIFCSFRQTSEADRWMKVVLIIDQFSGLQDQMEYTDNKHCITGHRFG